MSLTLAFSGSATEYAAGNGSVSGVADGSTYGIFRFENTSDVPIILHVRETGSSDDSKHDISPHTYSPDITLGLTSAKTIDYYIEGGGSIQCYIVYYFGSSGLSTVTTSDVASWIAMLGYTVNTTGNLTTAQIQLCLNKVVAEVNLAASRFELIALYAVNTAFKNQKIIEGAVAEALYVIRNKGAAAGLVQEKLIIAETTANEYKAKYDEAISNMTAGLNLGA